jgi:hypothetical protein
MRRWLSLSVILACVSSVVVGQEADHSVRSPRRSGSLDSMSATPEMWFYEQDRQSYEDSKAAVRRKAEFRSIQRQHRLESRKLYGLSNARPTASPTPLTSSYAPAWTSNTADPYRWAGPSQLNLVERRTRRAY